MQAGAGWTGVGEADIKLSSGKETPETNCSDTISISKLTIALDK